MTTKRMKRVLVYYGNTQLAVLTGTDFAELERQAIGYQVVFGGGPKFTVKRQYKSQKTGIWLDCGMPNETRIETR